MNNIKKLVQDLADHLMASVSGDGINGQWRQAWRNKNNIIIKNSFHCQDKDCQPFSIELPLNGDVLNFKLRFNEDGYLAQKYGLRGPLEDFFMETIHDWLIECNETYTVIAHSENITDKIQSLCLDPGLKIAEIWKNWTGNRVTKFEIIYPNENQRENQ